MSSTDSLPGLILTTILLASCDATEFKHTDKLPQQAEPRQDTIADTTESPATVPAICHPDEKLERRLHEISLLVIPGDNTLMDKQRTWLDKATKYCSQPGKDTLACCRQEIQERLEDEYELGKIPYSRNHALFAYDNQTDTLRIEGLLPEHILELAVVPAIDCPENCKDRQLAITRRTVSADDWQQNIELPGLNYSLAADGKILLDGSEIADKPEDLIWVEDFNFDGHQDFAVFKGYTGTKSAETWHIFLFDPNKNHGFSYAPALSELTYAQVFEVSHTEDGGYLHTFNKNSACSSTSSDWQIINNVPQEIKRFTMDCDHTGEDGRDGTLAVSQQWREGEWHTLSSEFTPDGEQEP